MGAEEYAESVSVIDQVKGSAIGLVAIGIMLSMQYSAAMSMRNELATYLNSNEVAPSGVADGVLTNMVSMMLTAVVVFIAVFAAGYVGKSILAGAATGVIAYLGYSVTHIVSASKLVEFKELMAVSSPAGVMSDGVILVLIPAAAGAYLAAFMRAKKAREAWGKAQARQAAIELEARARQAREAKAAALAAASGQTASVATPEASDEGAHNLLAEPVQTAVAPVEQRAPVVPVSSYRVCTTCGASNAVERMACFECGTSLAPA